MGGRDAWNEGIENYDEGEVRAACWDAEAGGGSPKRAVML
jgi:hypothetical protein